MKKTIFHSKNNVSFTRISLEYEKNGEVISKIVKFAKPYDYSLTQTIIGSRALAQTFKNIVTKISPQKSESEAFEAIIKVNGEKIDHSQDKYYVNLDAMWNMQIECAILGWTQDTEDLVLDLCYLRG